MWLVVHYSLSWQGIHRDTVYRNVDFHLQGLILRNIYTNAYPAMDAKLLASLSHQALNTKAEVKKVMQKEKKSKNKRKKIQGSGSTSRQLQK